MLYQTLLMLILLASAIASEKHMQQLRLHPQDLHAGLRGNRLRRLSQMQHGQSHFRPSGSEEGGKGGHRWRGPPGPAQHAGSVE